MKNNWILGLALSLSLAVANTTLAHEAHQPEKITGTQIVLEELDHEFKGTILGNSVQGGFDEKLESSIVKIEHAGKTLQLIFKFTGQKYEGLVTEFYNDPQNGQLKSISTQLEFIKAQKTGEKSGQFLIQIDGIETHVTVTGQSFQQGHFFHPTFETTLRGKQIQFEFSGQACFGYSANLAMMIFGAYAHLQKW